MVSLSHLHEGVRRPAHRGQEASPIYTHARAENIVCACTCVDARFEHRDAPTREAPVRDGAASKRKYILMYIFFVFGLALARFQSPSCETARESKIWGYVPVRRTIAPFFRACLVSASGALGHGGAALLWPGVLSLLAEARLINPGWPCLPHQPGRPPAATQRTSETADP